MTPITIEKTKDEFAGFTVRQGDRYSDGLCYEEMLGVVIALTGVEDFTPRFQDWVHTEDEWRRMLRGCSAKRKRSQRRRFSLK